MKYKTHEQLRITFAEHGALLGTLAMLKGHILVDGCGADNVVPDKHLFNMNVACHAEMCGTVGCIGGHMGLIMRIPNVDWYVMHDSNDKDPRNETIEPRIGHSVALTSLFFPRGISLDWDRVAPVQAVAAIEQFLEGREVDWPAIVDDYENDEYDENEAD